MYKLTQIKQVCEVVYGRQISDRTWRRWKHKLGFQDYEREVSQAKVEQLITFANMRRTSPLNQIDLLAVLNCKSEVIKKYSKELNDLILPDSCNGSQIPQIIEKYTGREPSIKTLYRWGKLYDFQFQLNRNYGKDEIEKWLRIGLEFFSPKKAAF